MRTTRQQRYDTGQHQLVCTDLGVSNNPDAPGPTAHEAVQDLKARVAELEAVIGNARSLAYGAPELNMSNYDHEQVRQLNDAMCEVFTTLDAAIDAARKERT